MKKAIKWLKGKIQLLFSKTDDLLFDNIAEAIMVANAIKKLVNQPATGIIISITPSELDNRIAKAINETMDEVMKILVLAKQCQEHDSYQLRLKCFVEQIRVAHPELQSAIYLKIASLFLHKKINSDTVPYTPISTCDTLIQVKYWENKTA